MNLEEELRMVGENLKVLEVAEEKAQLREEDYKKQIRVLSERLKNAEARLETFLTPFHLIEKFLKFRLQG